MKRSILLGALSAALLAPLATAYAQSNVSVRVSTPEFGIRIGGPVYHPVPVYAPTPVYVPVPVHVPRHAYLPPPVYVAPRVVYPAPRVIYPAPVIVASPRYYGPHAGVWVAPRPHGHRYRDGWHEGRREHRRERERDHYRAGYDD